VRSGALLLASLAVLATSAACGTTADLPATPAVASDQPAVAGSEASPDVGFVHEVDATAFPASVTFDAAVRTGDATWDNPTRDRTTSTMVGNVVITIVAEGGTETVLTPQQWQERVAANTGGEAPYYEPATFTFAGDEIVEVLVQERTLEN